MVNLGNIYAQTANSKKYLVLDCDNVDISGSLIVNGDTSFNGDVDISGDISMNSGVIYCKDISYQDSVKFSARPSADINNITPNNKIQFDTSFIDTHSAYDSATNIYTIPLTGDYFISANITVASSNSADDGFSPGDRTYGIKIVNGTTQIAESVIQFPVDNSPNETGTIPISILRTLAKNDEITLQFTRGGDNNNKIIANNSNICLYRIL